MVDDEVGHHVAFRSERGHVAPVTEPRVDARVVAGIEAGVGCVDRVEERQHMNAAE